MLRRLAARAPSPAVLKFYLYKGTGTWHFIVPISVVYRLSRGLSFAEVSLLGGVFSVGLLVWEVPTGYVGDRIGRRPSLVVGSALLVASVLAAGLARTFPQFLAVYVVWSVGVTFRSGAGEAWLYDVLKARTDEGAFARIAGRASAVNAVIAAVSTVLGAYLYAVDHFLPFAAAAGVMSVGGVAALTFPPAPATGSDEEDESLTVRHAFGVARRHLLRPPLRGFVLYVSLLHAASAVTALFVQPIVVSAGLSTASLGWIFGAGTAAGAAFSYATGTIQETVGAGRWFALSPVAVGLATAVVAVAPLAVVPAFVLVRGWNRATRPLRDQVVNDRTPSRARATLLSAVSMAYYGIEGGVLLVAGVLADLVSPVAVVAATGGGLVALAGAALTVGVGVDEGRAGNEVGGRGTVAGPAED